MTTNEDQNDVRDVAERLSHGPRTFPNGARRTVVTVARRDTDDAVTVLRAFAELPESTRRLARAASTVRARLGEGWEIKAKEPGGWDFTVRATRDWRTLSFHHSNRVGWMLYGVQSEGVGTLHDSLDDAITAALAALGEQE